MRKIILTLIFAALGYTAYANAGFISGFNRADTIPASATRAFASQIEDMDDDSRVVLQGYIVANLGGEEYLFKDKSGTVRVEIDEDILQGISITPNDMVEIEGEVDTHLYKPTDIEVKSIKFIEQQAEVQK